MNRLDKMNNNNKFKIKTTKIKKNIHTIVTTDTNSNKKIF